MQKIELVIEGLSESGGSGGSFLVFLKEKIGDRRLPIVIGGFEAQSIAIELQNIKTPRPLTHDLFFNTLKQFKIRILEVQIINLVEGVFYASIITADNNGNTVDLDARTSDALAMAIRFKAPIFILPKVLDSVMAPEPETNFIGTDNLNEIVNEKPITLQSFSVEELHKMLNIALENEEYEKAAKIRDEISKR